MPDASHNKRNAESTARLRALVEGLTADDFATSLGGGWTVVTALGHLAFWERRQAVAIARYLEDGAVLEEDDAANPALEPILTALESASAGRIAIEASAAMDAAVEAVADEAADGLREAGAGYLLTRHDHRIEHIEQIERGLGR